MIKTLRVVVCLVAGAQAAAGGERGLTWDCMPVYVGRTANAATRSRMNTWVARIESRQADESGYYELWTDSQPFYQEAAASQVAMTFRALCNKARSNACMQGQQPVWNERLDKVIFVH